MPKAIKKRNLEREELRTRFEEEWFKGGMYKREQPTVTLVLDAYRKSQGLTYLKDFMLSGLRDPYHPEKSIGLEIGPGNSPLFLLIPELKKIFFMDQSPELMRQLPKMPILLPQKDGSRKAELRDLIGNKMHRVVGDARRLPFGKGVKFDIVTMAEVLTHIKPIERLKVVSALSKHTNSLLIIDRIQPPFKDYQQSFRARERLRHRAQAPKWAIEDFHRLRVKFLPILKYFERIGWQTMWKKVISSENEEYFVLIAKRK